MDYYDTFQLICYSNNCIVCDVYLERNNTFEVRGSKTTLQGGKMCVPKVHKYCQSNTVIHFVYVVIVFLHIESTVTQNNQRQICSAFTSSGIINGKSVL